MKRIIPFMLFLCGYAMSTVAQDLLGFKKIHGLNSNVVYCVMQDSKGYIWVGTGSGAARYDGNKFVYFTTDEGLTNDDVFQIKEDAKGRLWFLNNSGKPSIYDHGKILSANNTPWLHSIQTQKLSIHWSEFRNNMIWYASLDTAYKIVQDKVVEKIALVTTDKFTQSILRVFNYKDTFFLMSTAGVYNTISKQYLYFESGKSVASLYSQTFQYKHILYYFTDNRLLCYDLLTKENKVVQYFPNGEWGLVFSATKNPDEVMVSTAKHFYKLNVVNKAIIATITGQTSSFITGILSDKEGNQWYSSLSDGLLLKKADKPVITEIIKHPMLPDSLGCNTLNKINNQIFVGYDKGYYMKLVSGDYSLQRFKGVNNLYSSSLYFQLVGKTIWCAATSKIIKKEKQKEFELSLPAKSIAAVNEGMYIATSEGVLFLSKQHYNDWENKIFQNIIIPLSRQRANRLLTKGNDTVFATGIQGMQMFVKQQKIPLPWKSEILHTHITKATLAANGIVLISTSNQGIALLTADSAYIINKANGLLSNKCYSIFSSGNNSCWVATARGVNKLEFTLLKNKTLQYSISEPDINEQLWGVHIYDLLQTNDTLLAATDKGLYLHRLTRHSKNVFYPPAFIESVKVNDSIYYEPKQLNLQHWQNRIQINFTGIALQATGKVKYRYKLLPVDSSWHYTENNFAEYPFLPAGNYTFLLSTSVAGYGWNPQQAVVHLQIHAPFWNNWWFIAFVVVTLTVGLFLITKRTIRNIKKQHSVERQIADLENKALRLQMNPHFIFNAINAIKGYYATGNIQDAKVYINTFSALMRLMLDTGNDNYIQLSNELKLINSYLKLCSFRYNQQFSFSVRHQLQVPAEQLHIPIMLIQPFIENAVQHGVASLKQNGCINIMIEQQGAYLYCSIDDNGVGRKKAQELSSRKMHNSKGVQITQQRLILLGVQDALKITDKTDALGNPSGTLVELIIPLQDNINI